MRATVPRRSTMVTRSWAWRATERNLRRSARIFSRTATVKIKKKSATAPVAAAILERKKPASASSEGDEITEGVGKILEPIELLKLKKKAFKAKDLWDERRVPGALERWKAEEAKEAVAMEEENQPKKRTKLVMTRLPESAVDLMKTQPYLIKSIPAEELERLDKMSYGFAEIYHKRKFIDDKMYAYEQALINQYNILGYAEDVEEITDDEQD